MHILILASFDASRYVLPGQVVTHVRAVLQAGFKVTLICEECEMAQEVKALGVSVIVTDFNHVEKTIRMVLQPGLVYTLVHTYPFKSRPVGLELARRLGIPFILSLHGNYTDQLCSYAKEVDLLLALNTNVKEYVHRQIGFPDHRLLVHPVGVDTSVFKPLKTDGSTTETLSVLKNVSSGLGLDDSVRIVGLRSAYSCNSEHQEKIIGTILKIQIESSEYNILWIVEGKDSLSPSMIDNIVKINKEAGKTVVCLLDDLTPTDRAIFYNTCNVFISNGEDALESMACGTPTLVVSEHKYIGLIDKIKNFYFSADGDTSKNEGYFDNICGLLCSEIDRLFVDDEKVTMISKFYEEYVRFAYDQHILDQKLLDYYKLLAASIARSTTVVYKWLEEKRPPFAFTSHDNPKQLSAFWDLSPEGKCTTLPQDNGALQVTFHCDPGERLLLSNADGALHTPPPDEHGWQVVAGEQYKIDLSVTTCAGKPALEARILEYNAQQLLSETTQELRNGANSMGFTPLPQCKFFRLAIGFSGEGEVLVSPLTFYKQETYDDTTNVIIPRRPKGKAEESHGHKETVDRVEGVKVGDMVDTGLPGSHQSATTTVAALPPLTVGLDKVSLCYSRTPSFFLSKNKRMRERFEHWALDSVSLSIYEGDTVALIGRNGSGKSTTSRMISGVLKPDTGTVTVNGKVQLLALGVGFRPELTGRENALLSAAILGMPRKSIKERMSEIEDFAELGDFFDEPLRTYSAGMRSRLGFAVSTAVNPDILILDEVMTTGDAAFRNKANKRMQSMRDQTKTVIIVSHNPALVRELCSRVVWLEQGKILMDGSTEEILPIYANFCKNPVEWLQSRTKVVAR